MSVRTALPSKQACTLPGTEPTGHTSQLSWHPLAQISLESSGDCLAEFGQVGSVGAWYVGGAATLTAVTFLTTAASSLEDCAAACKADVDCEYITYDYNNVPLDKKCFKKVNSAEDKAYAGIG